MFGIGKSGIRRSETRLRVGAVLVLLFAGASTPAHAQAPRGTEDGAGHLLLLGAWFGAEELPQAMDPGCGYGGYGGTVGGMLAGGFVMLSLGRLGLEGGASRHFGSEVLCPGPLVERDGVHTDRDPQVPVGAFTTTEGTLRLGFGGSGRLVVAAGAGWAWSKDVPYATGSLGLRVGHALQAGFDVVMRLYRVPWRLHTGEYVLGEEVRVLADESYHDWMGAIAVRVSVATPLLRF